MNELLTIRPMPIRKIKNNAIRRTVMIIMFIPLILLTTVINAAWIPFRLLIAICQSVIVLSQSMAEFWDNPEQKGERRG